jgi:hypothetical protein
MITPIDALVASEEAKIELLRAKIKDCERRIEMLRAMQSGDDDLDAALSRKVSSAAPKVDSDIASLADPAQPSDRRVPSALEVAILKRRFPKKSLGESAVKLLRFAGVTEKSIDQFMEFMAANNIDKSRQGIRAFLHQYKTTYQLLSSERDGYFRLSETGIAYLASLDAAAGGTTSAR